MGPNSSVDAVTVYLGDVYVGGSFTQAGTSAVSNIAMWDGLRWHALNSGVNGIVRALLIYIGSLWVGGHLGRAALA